MPATPLGREVRGEINDGGAERGSRGSSAADNFRFAPAIRHSTRKDNQPHRSALLRLQLF